MSGGGLLYVRAGVQVTFGQTIIDASGVSATQSHQCGGSGGAIFADAPRMLIRDSIIRAKGGNGLVAPDNHCAGVGGRIAVTCNLSSSNCSLQNHSFDVSGGHGSNHPLDIGPTGLVWVYDSDASTAELIASNAGQA